MAAIKNIGPIPQIGYGTWNRDGQAAYDGVKSALEIGYRHIDTAEGYNNEEFVGKAIVDSGISRRDIFLATKIAPESFAPGQIMSHVEASLEKLQTPQVDLLYLHYPAINDEYDIEDYMAQFAKVHDKGLTKHLAVSNFTIRHMKRALELLGERQLVTNQVEIHAFMQNKPIVDYCKSVGVPMTAYSPLARGAVSNDAALQDIAQNHDATPAQIALAFLMHEGHVVIPSAGSFERIKENFEAKNIGLTDAEMMTIRALDKNMRLVNGPWCPKWDE